jgi:hypothetical protein
MSDGWIKIHRELLDKPIWILSTPEQKTILITLLLMANHTVNKWEFKGTPFTCMPGQFITSLDSIVKKSGNGISVMKVRTALERFEKYEFLTNSSTNKNRLITICNWDSYQTKNEPSNKQSNKQVTSTQQADNKQVTTNKNVKNDLKNEKILYFEDSVLNNVFLSFLENRKDIKKPATGRAVKLLVKKLDSFPNDLYRITSLEKSIINNWIGVFELKNTPINGQPLQVSASGSKLHPLTR